VSLYEERAARNEALFREVNEEVEALARRGQGDTGEPLRLVCECANAECSEIIAVPVDVYEQVRSNARRFVIRPAHESPAVERMIAMTAEYAIVEKDTPTTTRIAERTDPRG
jgi:hypothetical protein